MGFRRSISFEIDGLAFFSDAPAETAPPAGGSNTLHAAVHEHVPARRAEKAPRILDRVIRWGEAVPDALRDREAREFLHHLGGPLGTGVPHDDGDVHAGVPSLLRAPDIRALAAQSEPRIPTCYDGAARGASDDEGPRHRDALPGALAAPRGA